MAPSFNRISGYDLWKLRLAAWTLAVSTIADEDVKRSPWKFPFYAVYMPCAMTPWPVPGVGTTLIVGAALYISIMPTRWAKWARTRLKDSFNKETAHEVYKDFLQPHSRKTDMLKVKGLSLTWDTTVKSLSKMWETTKFALNHYAEKYFPA